MSAAEEWIEWAGGECPVSPGTAIFYRRRDLSERATALPAHLPWSHASAPSDIIAYRVVAA